MLNLIFYYYNWLWVAEKIIINWSFELRKGGRKKRENLRDLVDLVEVDATKRETTNNILLIEYNILI